MSGPLDWRRAGDVRAVVPAAPDVVYAAIADVTGTSRRSLEVVRCRWQDPAVAGVVGARFEGANRARRGTARWTRTCEIVAADPGRRFAFRTVPSRNPAMADSTEWAYELRPVEGGTEVTHSYRIVRAPRVPFRFLFGVLLPHHRDMRPHMAHTLSALAREIAGPPTG